MRETSFIKQNKNKWKEFEQTLESENGDPDKLNDLFIQVTDDLSYSRTFYPNRSVRVYLNSLAQRVFFSIYKNRKSKSRRLLSFWTDELPQMVHEARREFRLSFMVFSLAVIAGAVSCAMDPEFVSVILGQDYVDMTIENIESGDPMAVYKAKGEFGMFLGITANNLFVAFLTFVMGVFFMIGSMVILIGNGVMLGAFQYFFVEQGLFAESFLTIWIHGALEISAIVIAGAAGLTLGKGLVFPGTYTRLQAFQRSARRGVKIMIGIVPLIVMAGFFEGYLTRHTETSNIVRGLFIFLCLSFVVFYFIWYPRWKAKKGFEKPIEDTRIPADRDQDLSFGAIKSSADIFADIFVFYKKYIGRLAIIALGTSALYALSVFLFANGEPTGLFYFPARSFGTLSVIDQFFLSVDLRVLPIINIIIFGLISALTFSFLEKEYQPNAITGFGKGILNLFRAILGMAGLMLILWSNDWYTLFLIMLAFPVLLLWTYIMIREEHNPVLALGRTFALLNRTYGRAIGLFIVLSMLGLLFFSIIDTMLAWFFLDLVSWIVYLEEETMRQVSVVLLTFVTMFMLHLVFTMFLIGSGLLYFTLLEIREAGALKLRMQRIGSSKKIRGLEKES